MFSTFKLRKWIWITLVTLGTLGLLAAAERQHANRRCRGLNITVDEGQSAHRFVSPDDVKQLITNTGTEPLVNTRLDRLDLKMLEARVKSEGLVKECQIGVDLSGNLNIAVTQHQPIARLIERQGVRNDADGYLNAEGQILPTSEHYTARVLLISGVYFDKVTSLTAPRYAPLMKFINYVVNDPFWRAQVAQIQVERDGAITLFPQVGSHRIEFGPPDEPEAKFLKLKLFYKQILAARGWDAYKRVSVRYRNQIVCEPAQQVE
ncbi:MAG: hypothetical protein LH606_22180 [Cytophagaceae bacterium]|nr:hypothetical protein [Cytophagaceae bacterium]